jgi:thioesterase domain-containing protein
VPKPYGGSAVIFRSSRARSYPYSDDSLGWKPVIRGDIEYFEIEADHESIFDETAARLIAEKLETKLAAY